MKALEWVLAIAGAWFLWEELRKRQAEASGVPASSSPAPVGQVNPGLAVQAGDALGGYTAATPVVYVGPGGVVRETNVANLQADYQAIALYPARLAEFLNFEPNPPRLAPGTGVEFQV